MFLKLFDLWYIDNDRDPRLSRRKIKSQNYLFIEIKNCPISFTSYYCFLENYLDTLGWKRNCYSVSWHSNILFDCFLQKNQFEFCLSEIHHPRNVLKATNVFLLLEYSANRFDGGVFLNNCGALCTIHQRPFPTSPSGSISPIPFIITMQPIVLVTINKMAWIQLSTKNAFRQIQSITISFHAIIFKQVIIVPLLTIFQPKQSSS